MTARTKAAKLAVLQSWARTPDRTARTRNGRNAGPASLDWHIARQDPDVFADATDEQRRLAAEAARTVWYSTLAAKSAAVRQRVAS